MTLSELKQKIHDNNVPERWYSLDNGLKPDACILYRNYSVLEFFYLDEKGEKHDLKIFKKDDEAYDHLWAKLEYQLRIFDIHLKTHK
jgi:hypothetical protein